MGVNLCVGSLTYNVAASKLALSTLTYCPTGHSDRGGSICGFHEISDDFLTILIFDMAHRLPASNPTSLPAHMNMTIILSSSPAMKPFKRCVANSATSQTNNDFSSSYLAKIGPSMPISTGSFSTSCPATLKVFLKERL
jgi:hypothetical protein